MNRSKGQLLWTDVQIDKVDHKGGFAPKNIKNFICDFNTISSAYVFFYNIKHLESRINNLASQRTCAIVEMLNFLY